MARYLENVNPSRIMPGDRIIGKGVVVAAVTVDESEETYTFWDEDGEAVDVCKWNELINRVREEEGG